jgi:hypothetical protein
MINIMQEKPNVFENLVAGAEDYARTTLELLKLKTIDRLSDAASSVLSRIIAFVFFFMFFLTASIGLCLWLGEIMGRVWAGFMLVAGIYGLIAIILSFILHKWFKRRTGDIIIRQIFK